MARRQSNAALRSPMMMESVLRLCVSRTAGCGDAPEAKSATTHSEIETGRESG